MNTPVIDTLARRLANPLARRRTIVLVGSAVSALLLHGAPPVAAACQKVGRKCDRNKDCCKQARCGGKKCKCERGFTECGGQCYSLDKDEKHCGSCNTACAAGERCVAGACAAAGCTAALDSCAEGAGCIACPDRADAVCYLDNDGVARCSRFLVCMPCEDDADCGGVASNARCLVDCSGQCSGTACASD